MIDEKEMIEVMRKRINYFYKHKIKIHISLKTERFYNGKIKEISEDYFIIDDFVEGDTVIFYLEILPNGINKYIKKGKNEERI